VGPTNCPACGAPVAAGSGFCTYCGASLTGPSSPLPAASGLIPPPPPSMGPSSPYAGGPSRPVRRRSAVLIALVVVVVIVLVAGGLAFFLLPSSTPPVQIAYIVIYAPDNVCGLNLNPPVAYYGYNSSTSANLTLDFPMPNYNATACIVHGVSTNTSGFSVPYAQVPLTIGGSPSGPGSTTGSMNITIVSPSSSFSGNLDLILR
jgi:hypothetical protein